MKAHSLMKNMLMYPIVIILIFVGYNPAFAREDIAPPELKDEHAYQSYHAWPLEDDSRLNRCSPNPLRPGELWEGRYFCSQGWTELKLRIIENRDDVTKAVFEFFHEGTGVRGSYYMLGQYNPKSRRFTFVPSDWISRPAGYIAVGMNGKFVQDRRFEGDITYCDCGEFHLERKY